MKNISIQDKNYDIIDNLMEEASHGKEEVSFMSFKDASDLKALGQKLISPNLRFRIARVLSQFKLCFPRFIERWYLNQIKIIRHQYQVTFLNASKTQITEPLCLKQGTNNLFIHPIITPKLFCSIKKLIVENKKIVEAKKTLQEQGWTDEEIKNGIKLFFEDKNPDLEQTFAILEKHCKEMRETKELLDKEKAEWQAFLASKHEILSPEKAQRFEHAPRFSAIFQGSIAGEEADFDELVKRCALLDMFIEIEQYIDEKDEETLSALNHHKAFLKSYPENLTLEKAEKNKQKYDSAHQHIRQVLDELKGNAYPKETAQIAIKILLKMTSFGTRLDTLKQYIGLKDLKGKMPKEEKGVTLNDSLLIKNSDGTPLVILHNNARWHGEMKCRQMAYEVEHALGGESVPAILPLQKGRLLQKNIEEAQTIDAFLETKNNAAEIIENLDVAMMHAYLTFGLIRGRANGNGANTIIKQDSQGKAQLYDIDEEEDFLKVNLGVSRNHANEGARASTMAAMGFPQGAKPYPRVLLKLFSWEGLKEKGIKQFALSNLSSRITGLEERLDKIVEICRFESQKENPELTPRDLYFMIYGKEGLYHKLKSLKNENFSDYEFFKRDVKTHDDKYPERKQQKSKRILSSYERNVAKLDSKYEAPHFPMYGNQLEQYPGQTILKIVSENLPLNDSLKVLEIAPDAFDENGWNQYKSACLEDGMPVKDFMLTHFLKGFAKRMTLQLCEIYPECSLTIENRDGKSYLQISKPEFFKEVDVIIQNLKNNNESVQLLRVEKDQFDLNSWETCLKEQNYKDASVNLINCLKGKSKLVASWVDASYISLYSTKKKYLSIKETDECYFIYYNQEK